MVRFALISSILSLTSYAENEAQFRAALLAALNQSPLSPVEKVQHTLDRLGYGPHPTILPFKRLLKTKSGAPDEVATNAAIVDFIVESLSPRPYNLPAARPVWTAYPSATLTRTQLVAGYRELVARRNAIDDRLDALQRAVPRDLARINALIAQRTEASRALSDFRNRPLLWERARLISHGVLEKHGLYVKLLYMWFNRFNVAHDRATIDLTDYIETINSHTFDSFQEMLSATARHPAMLAYLHNSKNFVKQDANGNILIPPNEDYARELLELHTLGIVARDASNANQYNLKDINQAALILSGWNIKTTNTSREFIFNASLHAKGEKTVMGRKFPEGEVGGQKLLEMLARHPHTARSVARMLVRHFISDSVTQYVEGNDGPREDRPEVQELMDAYQDSNGDLPTVYKRLFTSSHFWSRDAYRAKLKDPFHLVVSTLRGTGRVTDTLTDPLIRMTLSQMNRMTQPLFTCSPPTGYGTAIGTWSTTSNLSSFVDYAYQVAALSGLPADNDDYAAAEAYVPALYPDPPAMASAAIGKFLTIYGLNFSPWPFALPLEPGGTEATLLRYGVTPDFNVVNRVRTVLPVRSVAGGYFGSAEFMKH